jgi:hypothetical protein
MPRQSVKRVDPCPDNCAQENGCSFSMEVSWENKRVEQVKEQVKEHVIYAEDVVFKITLDGSVKCNPIWSFEDIDGVFFTFTNTDGTTTNLTPVSLDEPHRREMNPPPPGAPPLPPLQFDIEGSSGADGTLIVRAHGTIKEFLVSVKIKCYCICREFEPPGTSKDLTINELEINVPFKSYDEE